ncbi:MAG TPA: hypothetical protein VIL36_00205 [Acidimicrobiales bacterium]
MSRKRIVALGVGMVAVGMAAAPAAAGDGFTVSPTSGPPGTVITVSGTGCFQDGYPDRSVTVVFTDGSSGATAFTEPDDSGAWSTQLTVPDTADPDATYEVTASCWGSILGDNGHVIIDYGPVAFDVTGGGTPPTTAPPTTQPPTTPEEPEEPGPSTPEEPEAEVPTPAPATPVVDTPNYTG